MYFMYNTVKLYKLMHEIRDVPYGSPKPETGDPKSEHFDDGITLVTLV